VVYAGWRMAGSLKKVRSFGVKRWAHRQCRAVDVGDFASSVLVSHAPRIFSSGQLTSSENPD
jgi:hypothetical protein